MLPSLTDGFGTLDRGRRRMILAIVGLIVLWLIIVLSRHALWAQWLGYRIRHAEDPGDRIHYVTRLAGLGEPALPVAEDLLESRDPELRSFGLLVASSVEGREASGLVRRAIDDRDAAISVMALRTYAMQSRSEVGGVLRRLIDDERTDVAMWATLEFARREGESAVPVLVEVAREHGDVAVRAQAIQCLAMARAQGAVDPLISLLSDRAEFEGQTALEVSASQALAASGREMALDGAGHSPRTGPASAREIGLFAAQALRGITGQSFGYASEPEARARAIENWRRWRAEQTAGAEADSD